VTEHSDVRAETGGWTVTGGIATWTSGPAGDPSRLSLSLLRSTDTGRVLLHIAVPGGAACLPTDALPYLQYAIVQAFRLEGSRS